MPIVAGSSIKRLKQNAFAEIADRVWDVAFAVHRRLGRLFDELVYQREIATLIEGSKIEVPVDVSFDTFRKQYSLDLLVDAGALFEIKTVDRFHERHCSQLMHYLALTGLAHGKLINFGVERVEHEFVNTRLTRDDRNRFHVEASHWLDLIASIASIFLSSQLFVDFFALQLTNRERPLRRLRIVYKRSRGFVSPRLRSAGREIAVTHPWHDVTPGERLPTEFTCVIEIPTGSNVKYELDKQTGLLKLDRVLYSAVHYPANYGFIPQTLAEDDDPLDVLVLCQESVQPLTLVTGRAIGMMTMVDSGKRDHKILAVALNDPAYNSYLEAAELPSHRLQMLRRFFQDYKTLEGKAVEVDEFQPAASALPTIVDALERYSTARRRGFKMKP